MDELTFSYSLVHKILPAVFVATVAAGVWLAVCRHIHRDAEQLHREAIRLPDGYENMSVDEQLSILIARRGLAGRGSPADQLFFSGLVLVSILALSYLGLWTVGLTPANTQQREFISLIRESPFAQRPQITEALAAAGDSVYVSRQHFFAVEAAFNTVSKSMGDQTK